MNIYFTADIPVTGTGMILVVEEAEVERTVHIQEWQAPPDVTHSVYLTFGLEDGGFLVRSGVFTFRLPAGHPLYAVGQQETSERIQVMVTP